MVTDLATLNRCSVPANWQQSIRDDVLDALERCHTSYRLFMSSTGSAFGGFYQISTASQPEVE
jgi:hypothetical protein